MRKLFSLIAAVLFAGSMMADVETIFTYNGKGVTAAADVVKAGGTLTVYGGNTNIVADQKQKGNMCIKINKGFTKDGIYYYMGITLDKPLQAGDKITTAAFRTGTSACVYGMDFNAEADSASATDAVQVLFEDNLQVLSSDGVPADTTFEVPAAAAGAKFIRLYRKSGSTGLWIANFTITREGGVTPPAPNMNYYVTGNMTSWGPDANYMLTPDNNGLYKGEFTFTANDEFKVTYSDGTSIDDANWFPSGMGNNYVITEAGDYAITFNPAGNVQDWYYGYFTVAKKEVPVVTPITCAAVYALEKNAEVTLNDVTVTYVNGKNVWVKDATGAMLLYLAADATWVPGDVLTGVAGVVDIYNDLYEVKPSADQAAAVVVTAGEAPAPEVVTTVTAADDMNKYVTFKGISLEGEFTTDKATSITIYEGLALFNKFKQAYTFEAGKTYDVIGTVSIYKGALQVNFISAEVAGGVEPVDPKYPIIETYFATGEGWAADADSKAVYDAAGEKITVTIAADKVAQWQGQVKIKGPVAEEGKNYHFAMKMKANNAVNDITVKWQDNNNEPNLIYLDKAVDLVANTEWAIDTTVAGIPGNGILVLDFGFAKTGDIIEIYDLVIEEQEVENPYSYDYEPTEVSIFNIEMDTVELADYTADYGVVVFYMESADGTYFANLELIASSLDAVEELATYPINDSEQEGTFFASPGGDDEYDYGCYFGVVDGQYYNPYYMISGTVEMSMTGMTVHAISYNGSEINLTYTAPEEGVENIVLTEMANKVLNEGVVYVVRDNKIFNMNGNRVR